MFRAPALGIVIAFSGGVQARGRRAAANATPGALRERELIMLPPDPARIEPPVPALEIVGLAKSYRGGFWGRRQRPAVAGLTLALRAGEIFALLGHNGAGKTTTLKAILGLVRPDAGRIAIGGADASQPAARAQVGYLPEAPYFHENLTAAELLDFHGRLLGMDRARRRERAVVCLHMVGMSGEKGRRLGACSKGQRQRLGLAQALLGEPRLLILDEPQSGLDPLGRREVRDIMLAQKAAGVTILFSSHIVPDVEAVADRVAILGEGRLREIVDLRRGAPARAAQVWLAAPPPALGAAWQAAPDLLVRRQDGDRWQIEASDLGALARLLAACHEHGLGVFELQTGGSGLETEFLRRLQDDRVQPEVCAC